jgi:hypothetical protein
MAERTYSQVVPPPAKGWNTRAPISQMDPLYSPYILNYYPNNGVIDLRKGTSLFAVDVGTQSRRTGHVHTFSSANGTKFLLTTGIVSTGPIVPNVYSISTAGAVTNIHGAAVLSTTDVQYANFNGSVFIKSSSTSSDVYSWTGTGNIAAPGFTGPSGDDKALYAMTGYRDRLYFAATGDASIWYGGVNAIAGALTQFSVAQFLPRGGILSYIGSLSANVVNDRDDFFVMISVEGDVLVYSGSYPGSSDWGLIGRYFIGSPLPGRPFIRFQNDILVMTRGGIVSLMSVINGTPLENAYLTDIIEAGYRTYVDSALAGSVPNFSGTYFSSGSRLFFNILSTTSQTVLIGNMLVFNTAEKAWTVYNNRGFDLTEFDNKFIYSGLNEAMVQGEIGDTDIDQSNRSSTTAPRGFVQFAYNYMGRSDTIKQPFQIVPIMYENNGLNCTTLFNVDFEEFASNGSVSTSISGNNNYILYRPNILMPSFPGKAISVGFNEDEVLAAKKRSIQAVEVFWKEGDIRRA